MPTNFRLLLLDKINVTFSDDHPCNEDNRDINFLS